MASKFSIEDLIGNFNRLDIKVRLGVFFGFLLCIIAINYFAIMQFELKALNTINTQIKKHKDDITKLEADQVRLGQIKSGLSKLKQDFNLLQGKIRLLEDLPLVLEDISKMALASQLTINQITPSREGQEDFATVGSVKYFTVPVVVKVNAGYHNFGQFLNTLENSNVMFLVKEIRMEGADKQNSPIGITATFKVILADKPLEMAK